MDLKLNPSSTLVERKQTWSKITKNVWSLIQNINSCAFEKDLDEWEDLFQSCKSKHTPPCWEFEISKIREYLTIKNTATDYLGKEKNIKLILHGQKIIPLKVIEIAVLAVEQKTNQGYAGSLELELIEDGSGKIYPCPVTHPFLEESTNFKSAITNVNHYWSIINKSYNGYDIRWKIFLHDKDIRLVEDESLGGAFATALHTLQRSQKTNLKKVAISAKINNDGKFNPVEIDKKINTNILGLHNKGFIDLIIFSKDQKIPNKNFPENLFYKVKDVESALNRINEYYRHKSHDKRKRIFLRNTSILIFGGMTGYLIASTNNKNIDAKKYQFALQRIENYLDMGRSKEAKNLLAHIKEPVNDNGKYYLLWARYFSEKNDLEKVRHFCTTARSCANADTKNAFFEELMLIEAIVKRRIGRVNEAFVDLHYLYKTTKDQRILSQVIAQLALIGNGSLDYKEAIHRFNEASKVNSKFQGNLQFKKLEILNQPPQALAFINMGGSSQEIGLEKIHKCQQESRKYGLENASNFCSIALARYHLNEAKNLFKNVDDREKNLDLCIRNINNMISFSQKQSWLFGEITNLPIKVTAMTLSSKYSYKEIYPFVDRMTSQKSQFEQMHINRIEEAENAFQEKF